MNSTDQAPSHKSLLARRFRGFLPVVVDVETGGFNPKTDALLEIAAVCLRYNLNGELVPGESYHAHVQPFPGANLEANSLAFTGIDPHHPFRMAVPENEALKTIFNPVREELKKHGCTRAILVGHNSSFDLSFVKAAAERTNNKRNPFHQFSTFDTVTLAGLAFGQTVLARAVKAAGFEWDNQSAHSALYDAQVTATLFCKIVNMWSKAGYDPTDDL